MPDSSVIYLVWADNTNKFKIGWTSAAPDKRLYTLQGGNHERLHLISYMVLETSERDSERAIHDWMKTNSIGGEWFSLNPVEIRDLVNLFEEGTFPCVSSKIKRYSPGMKPLKLKKARPIQAKRNIGTLEGIGEKVISLLERKTVLKGHKIKSSIKELKSREKSVTEEILKTLLDARLIKRNKNKEYHL